MKTQNLIFGIFVTSFFLFSCCKDDNHEKVDYRDEYLGSFEFTTITSSFTMLDSIIFTDTLYFSGEISCGTEDTLILIHYLENSLIEPVLKLDGNLTGVDRFSGKFNSTNDLIFTLSWGGHGGGGTHKVSGQKQ
jgi:hypothetical protein